MHFSGEVPLAQTLGQLTFAVTRETKCSGSWLCETLEGRGVMRQTHGSLGPQHSWCLWDMVAGLSPAPGPIIGGYSTGTCPGTWPPHNGLICSIPSVDLR